MPILPLAGCKLSDLTNTSPLVNDGFITGFVMNNPGPITSIDSISFTNTNFDLLPGAAPVAMSNNGVSGSPFGDFDFGAALGREFFEAAVAPMAGIAVNASGNFTFNFRDTAFRCPDYPKFC